MATSRDLYSESFIAGTSLAAAQHRIVTLNGTATAQGAEVAVCSAATNTPLGVLTNDPLADESATVQILGIAKVVSNGNVVNIAAGDWVGPGADGKAYKRGTADTTVLGIALEASTTDGKIISVMLRPATVAVIT